MNTRSTPSIDGPAAGADLDPQQLQAVCSALGVETGHWAPPMAPVTQLPQLRHARELLALQRRFDTARVVRERWPGPPATSTHPWLAEVHVHAGHEVRVVLEGTLICLLGQACGGRGWRLCLRPGDWIALPAGVAHAHWAGPGARLDMLHLVGAQDGGVRPPAPAGSPGPVPAWPVPASVRLAAPHRVAEPV